MQAACAETHYLHVGTFITFVHLSVPVGPSAVCLEIEYKPWHLNPSFCPAQVCCQPDAHPVLQVYRLHSSMGLGL
jgi:hypothetical protein